MRVNFSVRFPRWLILTIPLLFSNPGRSMVKDLLITTQEPIKHESEGGITQLLEVTKDLTSETSFAETLRLLNHVNIRDMFESAFRSLSTMWEEYYTKYERYGEEVSFLGYAHHQLSQLNGYLLLDPEAQSSDLSDLPEYDFTHIADALLLINVFESEVDYLSQEDGCRNFLYAPNFIKNLGLFRKGLLSGMAGTVLSLKRGDSKDLILLNALGNFLELKIKPLIGEEDFNAFIANYNFPEKLNKIQKIKNVFHKLSIIFKKEQIFRNKRNLKARGIL